MLGFMDGMSVSIEGCLLGHAFDSDGEVFYLFLWLLFDSDPFPQLGVSFQGCPLTLIGTADIMDESYAIPTEIRLFQEGILDGGVETVDDLSVETAVRIWVKRAIRHFVVVIAIIEDLVFGVGDGRHNLQIPRIKVCATSELGEGNI